MRRILGRFLDLMRWMYVSLDVNKSLKGFVPRPRVKSALGFSDGNIFLLYSASTLRVNARGYLLEVCF